MPAEFKRQFAGSWLWDHVDGELYAGPSALGFSLAMHLGLRPRLICFGPLAFMGEKQIPFGNDKQKDKGKGTSETQIPFGNDNRKGKGKSEKQIPSLRCRNDKQRLPNDKLG